MFQPITAFPGALSESPLAIAETTMPLSFEGLDAPEERRTSFASLLGQVAEEIERPGKEEDRLTLDYLSGKEIDTHDIMIAGAQSDLMLQMSSAVISKVANAYQTLINMQV